MAFASRDANHISENLARMNVEDQDPLIGDLKDKVLIQLHHPNLGGGVGRRPRDVVSAGSAADVDQDSSLPLNHRGQDCVGKRCGSLKVDSHEFPPLFVKILYIFKLADNL